MPIVRATGGLADTVVDANPRTLADGTATGFAFSDPNAGSLWQTIERALALWPDRDAWVKLMRTGMNQDWSWDRSAGSTPGSTRRSRVGSARETPAQSLRP